MLRERRHCARIDKSNQCSPQSFYQLHMPPAMAINVHIQQSTHLKASIVPLLAIKSVRGENRLRRLPPVQTTQLCQRKASIMSSMYVWCLNLSAMSTGEWSWQSSRQRRNNASPLAGRAVSRWCAALMECFSTLLFLVPVFFLLFFLFFFSEKQLKYASSVLMTGISECLSPVRAL